jgi:cobalt-zinc-cadmium efflux system outer membrane protein
MSKLRLAPVYALLLVSGCRTPPLQSIDESVADIASHPFDEAPASAPRPADARPRVEGAAPGARTASPDVPGAPPPAAGAPGPFDAAPEPAAPPPADGAAPTAALPAWGMPAAPTPAVGVIRTSFTQDAGANPDRASPIRKFELTIPEAVPGSETPLVRLPGGREEREQAVARLYAQLPPLPEEPVPLPGPDGLPYTLAALQRLAASNSPTLRQAASDVEAARGLLIQAGLYPNPTVGYENNPNANNTASTTQGLFFDQVIVTGGKLKLQAAAAEMNYRNAVLALRRARFDLATTIRGDYYTLLVARETVRVNKALAHFTDEIFRLQADLMGGGFAASHEPAALRSQAFIVRLAYKQAIANYVYAWKQLVADMGLKQLPLSAVEGQVDRLIPYYDYDAVLAHVLRNHTDVLTARNALEATRYTLKLARVIPAAPDVEVRADLWKENSIFPFQNFHTLSVSVPFPLWNRNQGGIRAAAAALVRAAEGPHQVEVTLTTNLAAAYAGYKTNLAAVEYYRRNILPDQVRYYRGVFERRKIDPTVAFGDLVQAQQVLVSDVTAYLGVLGSLWTSVVNVANFLQTDDLFQLGEPLELPPLPDFDPSHPLPCPHPQVACPPAGVPPGRPAAPYAGATTALAPMMPWRPGQWIAHPSATWAAGLFAFARDSGRSASDPERRPPILEPPPSAPSPLATPPDAPPPEALAPDFSRRPSAASSRSSS